MNAMVSFQNASVSFGQRQILHDITFNIYPNEFWTLIGKNGTGKSTLLGLFNGLTPLKSGTVHYKGEIVTPKVRQKIAHVFQATDLDPKMPLTVFEAVLAGTYGKLGLIKRAGKREKAIAMKSLESVGLSALANRPIGQLSEG
ncbi:MAG: ATP-binding cassette domain-containing protein, partial [Deferribacteraceae bacterium]|nr:ATP-binding cassette domain-containing protein [Deferribacteraceae bacterium]